MAASNSDIFGPNSIILSIALEKMGGGAADLPLPPIPPPLQISEDANFGRPNYSLGTYAYLIISVLMAKVMYGYKRARKKVERTYVVAHTYAT